MWWYVQKNQLSKFQAPFYVINLRIERNEKQFLPEFHLSCISALWPRTKVLNQIRAAVVKVCKISSLEMVRMTSTRYISYDFTGLGRIAPPNMYLVASSLGCVTTCYINQQYHISVPCVLTPPGTWDSIHRCFLGKIFFMLHRYFYDLARLYHSSCWMDLQTVQQEIRSHTIYYFKDMVRDREWS